MQRKTPSLQRSQGATLIVALVLLTAMTIIGVAAIDTASLQSNMARNSLYAQNLYQKALSEIQAQYEQLRGVDYLAKARRVGIALNDSGVETSVSGDPFTQSVEIDFIGDGPPPTGYSLGIYISKNFEIDSVTSVTGTGSVSDQTQGLGYPAPVEK